MPTGTDPRCKDAPRLPIGRYRLAFATTRAASQNGFLGSAWRGAFGHALKRAVCVTQQPECSRCMLYRGCTYPYVFETPPPPDAEKMRKYPSAPHPFVFVLPARGMEHDDAATATLGVNLFGRANHLLAHIVYALQQAGQQGVGPGRASYRLLRVEHYDEGQRWNCIYTPGGTLASAPEPALDPPAPRTRIRLTLETPLRLKREDQLVTAERLCFADLFGNLLRRISMLTYFHTDTPLETDFRGLVDMAQDVPVTSADLHWEDSTRYSSRQDSTMQMGGVVGTLEFAAQSLEPFWPYLWLGQWTHAGRFTAMGLGRYRIDDTASLSDPL
jgi:hypothetical protein